MDDTLLADSASGENSLGSASTLSPDSAPASTVHDATALRRGSTLGRYVILDVLGRGGMGIVYAAYDPELDRKIAIKLLKLGVAGSVATTGRSRLQREAQALAKLSHRNIVAVYDVGTIGDSIFVAMEFVAGETMAAWIKRRWPADPPHWRDVLAVMLPAGRGLAAAHAAGIIHRDFKPDNMMIDERGRVVVLDFGLARPAGTGAVSTGDEPVVVEVSASSSSLMSPLTVTGSVMGTPAYMSPEQFAAKHTEAATDQFSFCVALYQALYGERPFAGETISELTTSVFRHLVRPAPKGAKVPAWLRRVVVRGLMVKPAQRWPSMDDLLAALQDDPTRRWRRVAFGVVGVGALAAAVWGTRAITTRDDPCLHIADRAEAVWGPDRRDALAHAFGRDAKAYSTETLARVTTELDQWMGAWLTARADACEATRDAGPSDAGMRAACLDARLQRVDALVRVLADADQTMVEKALGAVQGLPKPDSCQDVESYRRSTPMPEEPALREPVEALRVRALDVRALLDTGRVSDAHERAQTLLDEARALGYEPIVGELTMSLGASLVHLGRYAEALELLEDNALRSRAHGLDALALPTLRALIFLNTAYTNKHDLADWQLREADALIRRTGDTPLAHAELLVDRARLERAREDTAAAITALERAVALFDEHGGSGPTRVLALDNLATSYLAEGRYDDAARVLSRAEIAAREALGPAHPLRGNLLAHQARVASSRGQHQEAIAQLQDALALFEDAYGDAHPNLGAVLNGLGLELERVGRRDEAIATFRRAASVLERTMGADHVLVATALSNLANVLRREGQAQEAETLHRRALAIRELRLSPTSSERVEIRGLLGDDLRMLGRCDEAEAEYTAAIAEYEKIGDSTTYIAYAWIGMGLCQHARGAHELAVATLRRALTTMDGATEDAGWRAYARIALAFAIAHAQRDDAQALAEEARALLATQPTHVVLMAQVERFIAGERITMPTM